MINETQNSLSFWPSSWNMWQRPCLLVKEANKGQRSKKHISSFSEKSFVEKTLRFVVTWVFVKLLPTHSSIFLGDIHPSFSEDCDTFVKCQPHPNKQLEFSSKTHSNSYSVSHFKISFFQNYLFSNEWSLWDRIKKFLL